MMVSDKKAPDGETTTIHEESLLPVSRHQKASEEPCVEEILDHQKKAEESSSYSLASNTVGTSQIITAPSASTYSDDTSLQIEGDESSKLSAKVTSASVPPRLAPVLAINDPIFARALGEKNSSQKDPRGGKKQGDETVIDSLASASVTDVKTDTGNLRLKRREAKSKKDDSSQLAAEAPLGSGVVATPTSTSNVIDNIRIRRVKKDSKKAAVPIQDASHRAAVVAEAANSYDAGDDSFSSSEVADTPGAVSVAGIRSAPENSRFETLDSVHLNTGDHLNETMALEDPTSRLQLSEPASAIVAQLVPDEDEFADRVQQQVEQQLRQITVNAVSVDESDINSTKIMGLSKPIFICLMAVLMLITASVIAMAVVLPNDGSTDDIMTTQAPRSAAVDELLVIIGDYIDKDGGSTITNYRTTQYQALDWLANVDEWNSLKQAAGGVPNQVLVERYALVMLYYVSSNGALNWNTTYPILSPTSVCDWFDPTTEKGVICDENHQFVLGLNLTESGIKGGQIPSELSLLSSLSHLDVSRNGIIGSLPTELGLLTELVVLNVNSNVMRGPIPKELGQCTSLVELVLSTNQLTGFIPTDLGRLTALTKLELFENYLSSEIPTEIGKLTDLSSFNVSNNVMSGNIPTELGHCTSLVRLNLSMTRLKGPVPSELGLLTGLTRLEMFQIYFSSLIPTEIGKLTELSVFNVTENQISGSIPTELGQCSSLVELDMSKNRLTGPIPSEIGLLMGLTKFEIRGNSLSSWIPTEVGKLSDLSLFHFNGNQISGPIPTEMGQCTSLVELDISFNVVTGPIPSEFGQLTNLTVLLMSESSLNGTIPTEIGKLSELSNFHINNNKMSGSIPTELGLLTQIFDFDLSQNGFDGSLDTIFCGDPVINGVVSDCLGENPEITCSCCIRCCNATACCFDDRNECDLL